MKTSELVGSLKELRTTAGHEAAVFLENGGGGGWPIGNVRRVSLAELKKQGIEPKSVAVAITIAEDGQEDLRFRAFMKKLLGCPEIADIYAEVGTIETPLLPVTGATVRKNSTVVISARRKLHVCCETGRDEEKSKT